MNHTKIFINYFMYNMRRAVFVNLRENKNLTISGWRGGERERERETLTGEFEETGEKILFTTAALRILNIRRSQYYHLE